jgi:hypothetical protein
MEKETERKIGTSRGSSIVLKIEEDKIKDLKKESNAEVRNYIQVLKTWREKSLKSCIII